MAQVLVAAVVVLAVLVAVMGVLTLRLRRQMRGLVAEVKVMRAAVESAGSVGWSRQARPPGAAARPPAEVSVITRLSDDAEPSGLTASDAASVASAGPLIKVAAFTHGVRRALDDEHRLRIRLAFRRELRRQRKARRRELRDAPAAAGSRS